MSGATLFSYYIYRLILYCILCKRISSLFAALITTYFIFTYAGFTWFFNPVFVFAFVYTCVAYMVFYYAFIRQFVFHSPLPPTITFISALRATNLQYSAMLMPYCFALLSISIYCSFLHTKFICGVLYDGIISPPILRLGL